MLFALGYGRAPGDDKVQSEVLGRRKKGNPIIVDERHRTKDELEPTGEINAKWRKGELAQHRLTQCNHVRVGGRERMEPDTENGEAVPRREVPKRTHVAHAPAASPGTKDSLSWRTSASNTQFEGPAGFPSREPKLFEAASLKRVGGFGRTLLSCGVGCLYIFAKFHFVLFSLHWVFPERVIFEKILIWSDKTKVDHITQHLVRGIFQGREQRENLEGERKNFIEVFQTPLDAMPRTTVNCGWRALMASFGSLLSPFTFFPSPLAHVSIISRSSPWTATRYAGGKSTVPLLPATSAGSKSMCVPLQVNLPGWQSVPVNAASTRNTVASLYQYPVVIRAEQVSHRWSCLPSSQIQIQILCLSSPSFKALAAVEQAHRFRINLSFPGAVLLSNDSLLPPSSPSRWINLAAITSGPFPPGIHNGVECLFP
ncbi:hypothetical protein DFH07DRAFT_776425 [Mycena maculata]|uniref:Uncharacterized protein n=1 Tax=Mycena maculata TaxID=230809 RepID=A0AAD7N4F7_9AGAR|nr:hypothetical protein DFH07DRAFT_776425 [Mycena maculata]